LKIKSHADKIVQVKVQGHTTPKEFVFWLQAVQGSQKSK
jgi:hypothetical protein